MTYRGFRSRTDLGMRKPKSVSYNVDPAKGGVAVHWGGDGNAPSDHKKCEERWRSWQNFHMDDRGWNDIAYSFGFCNHGYVLAGRGYGVRTAANGTEYGNDYYMAAVFVGGNDGPNANEDAFDALEWIIAECRRLGAGRHVLPHNYFKSTDCPGDYIESKLSRYHNKNVSFPDVPPSTAVDVPKETDMLAKDKITFNSSAAVLRGVPEGTEMYYEDAIALQVAYLQNIHAQNEAIIKLLTERASNAE